MKRNPVLWFVFLTFAAVLIFWAARNCFAQDAPPLPVHAPRMAPGDPQTPASHLVAALEQENAHLRAQMKAMVPAPLPEGRFNMRYAAQMAPLNVTLMDDHLYTVHVPDGMRISSQELTGLTMQGLTELMRTNRSATVLWLSAK